MGYDVATICTKLERVAPLVKKVKVLRDKLFAHRDHATEYNDAYEAAQLTADIVRSLLTESLTVLNEVAALHGLAKIGTSPFVIEHTESLLKKIQPDYLVQDS